MRWTKTACGIRSWRSHRNSGGALRLVDASTGESFGASVAFGPPIVPRGDGRAATFEAQGKQAPPLQQNFKGRGLPRAASPFNALRDGQDEFLFVRASNHLHSDGQTFRRYSDGDGGAWAACKV